MKKLETIFNDIQKDVEINNNSVLIDGNEYNVRYDGSKVCIDNNCHMMEVEDIIRLDNDIIRVEIMGYTVDINVVDPVLQALGSGAGNSGKINSPMAGIISKINVVMGQEVKAGDTLLVISAMKMENQINSPIDGVIANIAVIENEQINSNQSLMIIEEIK